MNARTIAGVERERERERAVFLKNRKTELFNNLTQLLYKIKTGQREKII